MYSSSATWAGIFPASITMFDDLGRVDVEATRTHAADLVDRGAHGIVSCGTSGEFVSLSDDERLAVIGAAVSGAAGRVPVIAGTGAYGTERTIELTAAAAEIGAAGAIVILPYYMRPSQSETVRFFEDLGAATPLPVMLYNNATNSAAEPVSAVDIGRLYRSGSIAAVKSTFQTVHQIHEVRGETDDSFRTFYGSFMAPLEGLAGGAHGWVSGILNVVLEDAVSMYNAMEAGNLAEARGAWRRILPYKYLYTRSSRAAGDIALWRYVLELQGRHGGHCRRPLLGLSADERSAVSSQLQKLVV